MKVTCPACNGTGLVTVDYDPYTNGSTEDDCSWCTDGLLDPRTAEQFEELVADLPRSRR